MGDDWDFEAHRFDGQLSPMSQANVDRILERRRLDDLQQRARLRRNNAPWYPDHDEHAFGRWLKVNDPGEYVVLITVKTCGLCGAKAHEEV